MLLISFCRPQAAYSAKDPAVPVPPSCVSPPSRTFDEGTIRKYARQILHALLFLHTHHISHRNLKPSNILITHDGNVLLSDYGGFHKRLYDYLDDSGRGKNLHFYVGNTTKGATAEVEYAQVAARKDDIFHLGLCLVSMAGGIPYEGDDIHIPEHLSRTAREFLHACFKRDPHERPEVATLLKHPFITHTFNSSNLNLVSLNARQSMAANSQSLLPPVDGSVNSSSSVSTAASNTSAATFSSTASSSLSTPTSPSSLSLASSSQSSQISPTPSPVITDQSTSSTTPEIIITNGRKDKSANALASFANARTVSDDDLSVSTNSTNSSIRTKNERNIPSRYQQDFEELETIGRGGFGIVVKARNKLDGRYYAIKKIKIDGSNQALTTKMLREVTTLSRLHHQYIVRYYQAWIERADFTSMAVEEDDSESAEYDDEEDEEEEMDDEELDDIEDLSGSLATNESEDWFEPSKSSASNLMVGSSPDRLGDEPSGSGRGRGRGNSSRGRPKLLGMGKPPKKLGNRDPQYLYIQMEYCAKKTLRSVIDEGKTTDEEERWYLFRQIIEGLSHIHQQGIIHRDLKVFIQPLTAEPNIL